MPRLADPILLTTPPYKDLVGRLATRWANADLPDFAPYLCSDYLSALGELLHDIGDIHQTQLIVETVLGQATRLDYSSMWVEQELLFEAMAENSLLSRADLLRLDLQEAGDIDATRLDEYFDSCNERTYRFTPTDHDQ